MVFAQLLGMAQDGGLPQPGCHCPHCEMARARPDARELVVSLGLVDEDAGAAWLIDATPDFPAQYDALAAMARVEGILLTHAHMGHYPGLLYLGREAMDVRAMPVYATARMARFLRAHAPWSHLVAGGHLQVREVTPGESFSLSPRLQVTPVSVPHRDEYSDTVAWLVQGPTRTLFYCPDIDHWHAFQPDVRTWLQGVDVALLDGTFFSPQELPHRDLSQIPHPLVSTTARLLAHPSTQVVFIHLNHSNSLWRAGEERAWVASLGLEVGRTGMRWVL